MTEQEGQKKDAFDPSSEIPLDPKIDKMVGDKLRQYFDALLDQKVPDRIVELLTALAKKDLELEPGKSE